MDAEAHVRLEVTVDGAADARVVDFELREFLSRPYELRLSVLVPEDTDPAALLGQDLVFTVIRARAEQEERTVGIVTQVRGEGLDNSGGESGRFLRLDLHVRPALALLSLRRNSRIFQDKKVPEIVQAILD